VRWVQANYRRVIRSLCTLDAKCRWLPAMKLEHHRGFDLSCDALSAIALCTLRIALFVHADAAHLVVRQVCDPPRGTPDAE
jgi:hypothetical protein